MFNILLQCDVCSARTGPVRVLRILCWMWTAEQEHDDIRTPHRKFGYIISSCPKVKEEAQLKPYGHEFPFGFCVPCWESWIGFIPIEYVFLLIHWGEGMYHHPTSIFSLSVLTLKLVLLIPFIYISDFVHGLDCWFPLPSYHGVHKPTKVIWAGLFGEISAWNCKGKLPQ